MTSSRWPARGPFRLFDACLVGSLGLGAAASFSLLACSDVEGNQSQEPDGNIDHPNEPAEVWLTDESTWQTTFERLSPATDLNPSVPADRDEMMSLGYGELEVADGWEHITRTIDDSAAPAAGPGARQLARFVHLADAQLADDESPARLASFDRARVTGGAFRPQETNGCRLLNAAVLTVNTFHEEEPVDFVLLGGDNIDNAQANESRWFLDILGGAASVECDSGLDDDINPDGSDGKDPFFAAGLAMPFYWVTGNHDVLFQGNGPVGPLLGKAVGSEAASGTRDWSQPGGPIVTGEVEPDPNRALLLPTELMDIVFSDGDGHGLSEHHADTGRAHYTFDVPNTPLRFVVLDTTAPTGGAGALLFQSELDAWVRPALDGAASEGKWVVLASHHATTSFQNKQPSGTDADPLVLEDEWLDFLSSYDNVLFSMVGHSHRHRVALRSGASGHAWWELITSALSDFPSQLRVVEIWDQDNGWVMLRATALDIFAAGDPVVLEAQALTAMDSVAGWGDDGRGELTDRNVELWVPAP